MKKLQGKQLEDWVRLLAELHTQPKETEEKILKKLSRRTRKSSPRNMEDKD